MTRSDKQAKQQLAIVKKQIKPGVYQHYKGKLYRVLFLAINRHNLKPRVVYECLYPNNLNKYWIRTPENFIGKVKVGGKLVPRYKFIRK